MAKRRATSSLASKTKSGVSKHKGDETNYGMVDLPGGIRNGIAKLSDCRFSKYRSGDNEGEFFFLAAGIVVSPDSVNGTPIRGLRTQIMEPVCDTTKANGDVVSTDDHVGNVLNELRKLGYDTEEMGSDELEEAAATLKDEAPYFRFSTSQAEPTEQFPNPRVWQNWHGAKGLEDYQPVGDEVVEEDEEEEIEDEEEPEDEIEDAEEEEGEEEEGDEEEELVEPEKGEVYFYKPPRKRKKVEVEVTAVFKSKETCHLKDLENDGKSYRGVAWSELSYEP